VTLLWKHLAWLGSALMLLAGCIVDEDAPCGPRQVKVDGLYEGCVCQRGYVWTAEGDRCVKCGRNEVVRGGACVCDEGFERTGSGAPCVAIEDAAMPDAEAPVEAGPPAETGEGTACTTSADCEGLYATFCMTLQAPSMCLIQNCANGEYVCTASRICCSFAGFAPLESTNGLCIPAANCIGPGKPVAP
jgi:hypothetical protein